MSDTPMEQSPKQSPAVEPVADLIERLTTLAAQIDPLLLGGPDARLLNDAAASLSQLSTKLENAERERDDRPRTIDVEKLLLAKLGREWTPTGISIVSLIDDLAQERDELRAKLAEAIKIIDLAVDLQCELGSHYELRAAAIRARAAVQGAGQS